MNTTTSQQANTDQLFPTDPKGAKLRQTLEHLTLQKMIDQLREEEFTPKQLCDLLHTYCELKKSDAAQEKTRSTERIAEKRINKTNNPTNPCLPPRDHQSTPPENEQSHEDFCRTLSEAAMDTWGVDISSAYQPNKNKAPTPSPTTHSIHNNNPTQPRPHPHSDSDPDSHSHSDSDPHSHAHPHANPHPDPDPDSHTHAHPHQTNPAHTRLPLRDPHKQTDPSATEDLYDIPPKYRQGATPIKGSQEKYGQPKYTQEDWRRIMFRAIRTNYGIHDNQQTPPNTSPKRQQGPTPKQHPRHQPEALARTDRTPPRDNQEFTPPTNQTSPPNQSHQPPLEPHQRRPHLLASSRSPTSP